MNSETATLHASRPRPRRKRTAPDVPAKTLFARAAHAAETAAFYSRTAEKYALEAQALQTLALAAQRRETRRTAQRKETRKR